MDKKYVQLVVLLLVAFFQFYYTAGMAFKEKDGDGNHPYKQKCNEICLFQRELRKNLGDLDGKSRYNFTLGRHYLRIKEKR